MVVVWVYTERMFSPTRVKNLPWVMTPYLYNPSNVELPTNAQLSKTVWSMGAFVFNGAFVSAGAGVAVGETVSAAGAVAGSTERLCHGQNINNDIRGIIFFACGQCAGCKR